MDVKVNKFPSYYILVINGELDFLNSFKFKEMIESILEENINNLIIDFTNLNYIDSSGIGALIKTSFKFSSPGKSLWLVNFHGQAERTMFLTRLNEYFSITTLDDAVSKINAKNSRIN